MDGVRTAADEGPAVGTEGQRADVTRAEQRFADRPTRRHLPESQAVGPDREHGTVGAEREAGAEAVDTAHQRLADPAPCDDVPEAHGLLGVDDREDRPSGLSAAAPFPPVSIGAPA